jgi:hypothetical protein
MKWFRRHLKQGSRLALFALAVQFALSFGHFHGLAAQAAPALKSSVALGDIADTGSDATARPAAQQQSPADHDPDQQSGDNCAICAVMAMANAVLLSPPPLLQLPQALEFLYRATDAEFVHLKSVGDAFQPRAPPAS